MSQNDGFICSMISSKNQDTQAFTDNATGTLQQLGQLEMPKTESNFHSIIIVGQMKVI